MGMYLNPGKQRFQMDADSRIYVDKTGLLAELNRVLSTSDNCISLSHARRFGKSQAADMIDAYYSRDCDSRDIFSRFKISKDESFEKHLNRYNVIHWDVASFTDYCGGDVIESMTREVTGEMKNIYPDTDYDRPLYLILYELYMKTGIKYVIIVDEWDCIIRNYSDSPELVHRYMQFMHSLFKSAESKRFLALGYITGILPIKKIDDESALNNFREYTMINSWNLAPYYGFTEDEVKELCIKYDMPFDAIKTWYNGYLINGQHMYNPNSVNQAMSFHGLSSFWKNTSAYGTINRYITLNFDGLKEDIISILAGRRVPVNTDLFMNDLSQINSKDDALTALIHLGYLAYDEDSGCAYLPNYEVATAYRAALQIGGWKEIADWVFVPRADRTDKPAIIIELKWDKPARAAIDQIKSKFYYEALKSYDGEDASVR